MSADHHAYKNINGPEPDAPEGVCAHIVDEERRLCMKPKAEHLTGLALTIAQKRTGFDRVLAVSADHEFYGDADTCDRLLDKAADIHCDHPRSEHPPAQVVEARPWGLSGNVMILPPAPPTDETFIADRKARSARLLAPTDPARKGEAETLRLARDLAEVADETLTSEGDPDVYTAEMEELARRMALFLMPALSAARQAGAEAMREACATAAENAEPVGEWTAGLWEWKGQATLNAAAEAIRALPIPEPGK